MSDMEEAINASKKYESLLEQKYSSVGKGLHEKVSYVENVLPYDAITHLRRIATIRNKIVHEDNVTSIENRSRFEESCIFLDLFFLNIEQQDNSQSAKESVVDKGIPEKLTLGYLKSYPGWGSIHMDDLLKLQQGLDLAVAWENASGLKFVKTNNCENEFNYWLKQEGNRCITSHISREFPRLVYSSLIQVDNEDWKLYPYVTKPTPIIDEVAESLKVLSKDKKSHIKKVIVGITSERVESIKVFHWVPTLYIGLFGGLKIKKNKAASIFHFKQIES